VDRSFLSYVAPAMEVSPTFTSICDSDPDNGEDRWSVQATPEEEQLFEQVMASPWIKQMITTQVKAGVGDALCDAFAQVRRMEHNLMRRTDNVSAMLLPMLEASQQSCLPRAALPAVEVGKMPSASSQGRWAQQPDHHSRHAVAVPISRSSAQEQVQSVLHAGARGSDPRRGGAALQSHVRTPEASLNIGSWTVAGGWQQQRTIVKGRHSGPVRAAQGGTSASWRTRTPTLDDVAGGLHALPGLNQELRPSTPPKNGTHYASSESTAAPSGPPTPRLPSDGSRDEGGGGRRAPRRVVPQQQLLQQQQQKKSAGRFGKLISSTFWWGRATT